RYGAGYALALAAAASAPSGIFAAVPRVNGDDDEAFGIPPRVGLARCRAVRLGRTRLRLRFGRDLRRCRGIVTLRLALFQERHQRIRWYQRIEIEHQPMAVIADRREREGLRLDLALEVEHQANHAGLEAPDAHRLPVPLGA